MQQLALKPITWIFLAFIALALVERHFEILQPLERRLSDRLVRLQAQRVQPDPDVIIVDIDDKSLERMADLADRWPWPRAVHGELVAGIAAQKPKAIVFDLLFTEPNQSRPESDELFNQMLAPVQNVYFPIWRGDPLADAFGPRLTSRLRCTNTSTSDANA